MRERKFDDDDDEDDDDERAKDEKKDAGLPFGASWLGDGDGRMKKTIIYVV